MHCLSIVHVSAECILCDTIYLMWAVYQGINLVSTKSCLLCPKHPHLHDKSEPRCILNVEWMTYLFQCALDLFCRDMVLTQKKLGPVKKRFFGWVYPSCKPLANPKDMRGFIAAKKAVLFLASSWVMCCISFSTLIMKLCLSLRLQ